MNFDALQGRVTSCGCGLPAGTMNHSARAGEALLVHAR